MNNLEVVILAAGLGTRLSRPLPKALTTLRSGEVILDRQIRQVRDVFGDVRITVVVGFKMELIMEAAPDVAFAYNERYDRTNTSQSLLKALRLTSPGTGVLWMNGDVVFEPRILHRMREQGARGSCVAVDHSQVGDEEVTYTLNDGLIGRIAKGIAGGVGEAVGVNYVSAGDRDVLIKALERCDDEDYFERGIELTIADHRLPWRPVDISGLNATEVDFEEDLDAANRWLDR